MAQVDVPLVRSQFAQTSRADNWWVQPLVVFLGLSAFIVYSTWAALQGQHYRFGPYLSPLYSPELFGDPLHAWFGIKAGLDAGVGYGRDAHPVGAGRLPRHLLLLSRSVLQSLLGRPSLLHRGRAAQDVSWGTLVSSHLAKYSSLFSLPGVGVSRHSWPATCGMGSGLTATSASVLVRLVLLANVTLLSCYTFGCHSLRHLVGGFRDRLSGAPVARRSTTASVVSIAATCCLPGAACSGWRLPILYVRMCSMGVWTDWRIF